MTKKRMKMILELGQIDQALHLLPSDPTYTLQNIHWEDSSRLGELLYDAYFGTIDYEGEALEDLVIEARDTLHGKYGPLLSDCSFMAMKEGMPVAACIITLFRGLPLVTYNMTHPSHHGRGLSTALLQHSIHAVRDAGFPALYLVVTIGNHVAQHIYYKLGFQEYHQDWPSEFID